MFGSSLAGLMAAAAGGGADIYVGQFRTPVRNAGAQGTEIDYTDVPFSPTTIVFFSSGSQELSGVKSDGASSSGGDNFAAPSFYGFVDQDLGQACCSWASRDDSGGPTATRTSSGQNFASAISLQGGDGALTRPNVEGQVTALLSNGFRILWIEDGVNFDANVSVTYVALGKVSSKVINWQANTSGLQDILGAGFDPDLVNHMCVDVASNVGYVGSGDSKRSIGWSNGNAEFCNYGFSESGVASGNGTGGIQTSFRAYDSNGSTILQFATTDMITDGFRANVTDPDAMYVSTLCLGGLGDVYIGNFTPAGGDTTTVVSGLSFKPRLIITDNIQGGGQASNIGAALDGGNQMAEHVQSRSGASGNTNGIFWDTYSFVGADSGTPNQLGYISSWTNDGFIVTWDNDATGGVIHIVAIP